MNKLLDVKFPNIYKAVSEIPNPRDAFETLRSACAVMDEMVRSISEQAASYQKPSREHAIALGLLESVSSAAVELRNRFNISRMLLATNDPYRVSTIIESLASQLEQESMRPQGGFTPPPAPAEPRPFGAAFVRDEADEFEQEIEKPIDDNSDTETIN